MVLHILALTAIMCFDPLYYVDKAIVQPKQHLFFFVLCSASFQLALHKTQDGRRLKTKRYYVFI